MHNPSSHIVENGNQGNGEEGLPSLADLASKFAVTSVPAPASEVDAFLALMAQEGARAPAVPPALSALWGQSREWHLLASHYGVFGLNFFQPDALVSTTAAVFGDEECRRQWAEDLPSPNCAEPGWACFGSFSEFDYLFVNVDAADARSFGAVRRVVNNCCEEARVPATGCDDGSGGLFLRRVARFVDACARCAQSDEDPPCFRGFLN